MLVATFALPVYPKTAALVYHTLTVDVTVLQLRPQ